MTNLAPTDTDTTIRLVDVTRSYRATAETVTAVDRVSLELRQGELVGLVGPSGSGKTTLINLLAGWEAPDEGSVQRSERVVDDWSGVAIVPQGIGLLPELTAHENVEIVAWLGFSVDLAIGDLLAALELGELVDREPHEISMGEQQRVAVARAVAPVPALLVADEPTAHQDEANADRVMAALARCAAQGSTVLVATHDQRMIEGLDRVLFMSNGRLVGR
ncbi:MAG: ATP-binding cassette domain-containing protein [Acidimicrobiia bacterium]|nr:ATP-binding cassette domain-containing protein [Acidimicrobiia bacterium]